MGIIVKQLKIIINYINLNIEINNENQGFEPTRNGRI